MSSSKIYQIYFNEATKAKISPRSVPFDNSSCSEGTYAPAFENHVIKRIFDEGLYGDASRVGILSWAFEEKNGYKLANLDLDVEEDVVTFEWHPHKRVRIFKLFESNHPGVMGLIDNVLKKLGYNIDLEAHETIPLYQNAHITKPRVYKRYVDELLTPVMDIMFNGDDKKLMDDMYQNSNYRYNQPFDVARIMEITSRPYYTYHAFICETLPALFLSLNPDITVKVYGKC
jgi:hypothetical protein